MDKDRKLNQSQLKRQQQIGQDNFSQRQIQNAREIIKDNFKTYEEVIFNMVLSMENIYPINSDLRPTFEQSPIKPLINSPPAELTRLLLVHEAKCRAVISKYSQDSSVCVTTESNLGLEPQKSNKVAPTKPAIANQMANLKDESMAAVFTTASSTAAIGCDGKKEDGENVGICDTQLQQPPQQLEQSHKQLQQSHRQLQQYQQKQSQQVQYQQQPQQMQEQQIEEALYKLQQYQRKLKSQQSQGTQSKQEMEELQRKQRIYQLATKVIQQQQNIDRRHQRLCSMPCQQEQYQQHHTQQQQQHHTQQQQQHIPQHAQQHSQQLQQQQAQQQQQLQQYAQQHSQQQQAQQLQQKQHAQQQQHHTQQKQQHIPQHAHQHSQQLQQHAQQLHAQQQHAQQQQHHTQQLQQQQHHTQQLQQYAQQHSQQQHSQQLKQQQHHTQQLQHAQQQQQHAQQQQQKQHTQQQQYHQEKQYMPFKQQLQPQLLKQSWPQSKSSCAVEDNSIKEEYITSSDVQREASVQPYWRRKSKDSESPLLVPERYSGANMANAKWQKSWNSGPPLVLPEAWSQSNHNTPPKVVPSSSSSPSKHSAIYVQRTKNSELKLTVPSNLTNEDSAKTKPTSVQPKRLDSPEVFKNSSKSSTKSMSPDDNQFNKQYPYSILNSNSKSSGKFQFPQNDLPMDIPERDNYPHLYTLLIKNKSQTSKENVAGTLSTSATNLAGKKRKREKEETHTRLIYEKKN